MSALIHGFYERGHYPLKSAKNHRLGVTYISVLIHGSYQSSTLQKGSDILKFEAECGGRQRQVDL